MPKDNTDLLIRREEALAKLAELNHEKALLKRELNAVDILLDSMKQAAARRERQSGQQLFQLGIH